MTTEALERNVLKRIKDGMKIDPRILADADDGDYVGVGVQVVRARENASQGRRVKGR